MNVLKRTCEEEQQVGAGEASVRCPALHAFSLHVRRAAVPDAS